MATIGIIGLSLPKDEYQPVWSDLISLLSNDGYTIVNSGPAQILISLDHDQIGYDSFIEAGGDIRNTILIRLETDSVYPKQYTIETEALYNSILTFGCKSNIRSDLPNLLHPYQYFENPAFPTSKDINVNQKIMQNTNNYMYSFESWKNRKINFSYIGSNKIGLSKSNMYSQRRNLLKSFAKYDIQIYGILWDFNIFKRLLNRFWMMIWAIKSKQRIYARNLISGLFDKYMNVMGVTQNKSEILGQSRFTLIVENSENFITEKLFDALLAGCVPIYLGPDLDEFSLPNLIAYEIKKHGTDLDELFSDKTLVENILQRGYDFIISTEFILNWHSEQQFKKIYQWLQKNYLFKL